MDREYLTKHNLMEAHKQFMRLSEGYLATALAEADDDEEMQPQGHGMPNMDTTDNQVAPDMNPDAGNADNQPVGDEINEPEQTVDDMPALGQESAGETIPQMSGNDGLKPEENDEVLDVEDLTQAQEKLNDKQNSIGHDLGEVDGRIIKLLTAVEKIQGSLERNNNDITALKAELEKRVPTDKEKLNMQSLKMYPFNVSPNKYWEDKEKDGRYEAQEKPKEYKITQSDVDEYSDSDIEKSFDNELRQTMKDIFKGY